MPGQPGEVKRVGVVMNGVTGRIGRRHLEALRAIVQDGLGLPGGETLLPVPLLLGRDAGKLAALGQEFGFPAHTTDLAAALADPQTSIYFDASVPTGRPDTLRRAIQAGKHVYAEKPLALSALIAADLARSAQAAGLRHGVVQNMLYQPGPRMLDQLVRRGFFGRILSARIDFGYWVYEGGDAGMSEPRPQRPSWNYRQEDGGGIVTDMFPHWNGLIERLFGRATAVSTLAMLQIPQRYGEEGQPYTATAEDSAYSLLELAGGVSVQINASWCARVYRDDMLSIQIDGTGGSAVADYHHCRIQRREETPAAVGGSHQPRPQNGWQDISDPANAPDPFRSQWEDFLRATVGGQSVPWDFWAAARGLTLAETALRSSRERRWQTVPAVPGAPEIQSPQTDSTDTRSSGSTTLTAQTHLPLRETPDHV